MTRLITGLEVHRYAPELNTLHLRTRHTLPAPGFSNIKEAKARLFGCGHHQLRFGCVFASGKHFAYC